MYGGYQGYPPPGTPQIPLGYGPPPGSFPPPGAPYGGGSPAPGIPLGYGPPPTAAPPIGYGPPPNQFQQMPGFSQPPPFMPQGAPVSGPPTYAPAGPRHVGLGAPGAPTNIPLPNATPSPIPSGLPMRPAATPPGVGATGEVFRMFVGSIAEGVDDAWLEQVLSCAGPVMSLKRMKEASGKPKAFGFAEYGDQESVARCLEMLNGTKLPVNGGKDGEKALTINVDEKTKAKIEAWQKERVATDQDGERDKQALERLDGILSQMRDPSVLAASAAAAESGRTLPPRYTHLQDLAPEDLPDESRGMITQEIKFFREQAVKRESSKRQEREEKINQGYYNQPQGGSASVNGHASQHTHGSPAGPRGQPNASYCPSARGAYGGGPHTPSGPRGGAHDAQSYSRPVNFVRAAQAAAAQHPLASPDSGGSPLTDEEEERLRVERKKQMAYAEYRERERRWQGRERQRGQAFARDFQRERLAQEDEARRRAGMAERLKAWDDENDALRLREPFYADRSRWRAARAAFRSREEAADRADLEAEEREVEAAKRASEAFLREQDEAFAKIAGDKRRGGLLQLDEGTPIKLSFGGAKVPVTQAAPANVKKESSGVLGPMDDGEEVERKRELIPLTYDDDMEDEKGLTEEQLLERENAKVRKLVTQIPSDKETLFAKLVKWEKLNETIIEEKLRPFANKKIVDYLGMQEDELVEAIITHVRGRKGAQGLVDELEPVLAEEAEEFAIKFWRMLHYEVLAIEAGVKTTLT